MAIGGLGMTGCHSSPGSCLGLRVGDELLFTIEGLAPPSEQPCAFESLGLEVGGQLRMSVEEQHAEYIGEGEGCQSSSGAVHSQGGWIYQPSAERLRGGTSYWASAAATNGECSGDLYISLYGPSDADLSAASFSTSVSITYIAFDPFGVCPLTCNGALIGTLSRSDG